MLRVVALGAVALLALSAAAGASTTAPPSRLYLSPNGSDNRPCTRAEPCRSIERGYLAARSGQVVDLAPGRYPGQQEVPRDSRMEGKGPRVIFQAAKGAAVTIDALDVFGDRAEFRGVRVERDLYVKCDARDFVFRNSTAGILFIRSAQDVQLVGSRFGPWVNKPSTIGPGDGCEHPPRRISIVGSTFRDFHTEPRNATHDECLMVTGVEGLTIRRSRFRRCEDFDILFKRFGTDADLRDITIENSWFDHPHPDGSTAIQFSAPGGGASFTNVTIRANSFTGALLLKPGITYRNVSVLGNAGTRYGGVCSGGVRSEHNVWQEGACGRTDRRAAPGFKDGPGFDLHLKPGAAAIDRGHPTSFPRTDIDGQRRPFGRRADAGADEARPR